MCGFSFIMDVTRGFGVWFAFPLSIWIMSCALPTLGSILFVMLAAAVGVILSVVFPLLRSLVPEFQIYDRIRAARKAYFSV